MWRASTYLIAAALAVSLGNIFEAVGGDWWAAMLAGAILAGGFIHIATKRQ